MPAIGGPRHERRAAAHVRAVEEIAQSVGRRALSVGGEKARDHWVAKSRPDKFNRTFASESTAAASASGQRR